MLTLDTRCCFKTLKQRKHPLTQKSAFEDESLTWKQWNVWQQRAIYKYNENRCKFVSVSFPFSHLASSSISPPPLGVGRGVGGTAWLQYLGLGLTLVPWINWSSQFCYNRSRSLCSSLNRLFVRFSFCYDVFDVFYLAITPDIVSNKKKPTIWNHSDSWFLNTFNFLINTDSVTLMKVFNSMKRKITENNTKFNR